MKSGKRPGDCLRLRGPTSAMPASEDPCARGKEADQGVGYAGWDPATMVLVEAAPQRFGQSGCSDR